MLAKNEKYDIIYIYTLSPNKKTLFRRKKEGWIPTSNAKL